MSNLVAAKKAPDVAQLLKSQLAEIKRALPTHLSPDRFARIALTELRKNPQLTQCDPFSFLGAVIQCAQLGLEPGNGLGHAYLIPFKNRKLGVTECQFIPGYKGLIDLCRRSGQIDSISARVVYEKDFFEFEYGDDERIKHRPYVVPVDDEGKPMGDAGRIMFVYAIAKLKDGGVQREVMTREQIMRVRDRGNTNPVWETDFDEMARKTVVRRIVKYLPVSASLSTAISADNSAYNGETQENWKALDINYEPQAALPDPEKFKEVSSQPSEHVPGPAEVKTAATERQIAVTELTRAWSEASAKKLEIKHLHPGDMSKLSLDEISVLVDKIKAMIANSSTT